MPAGLKKNSLPSKILDSILTEVDDLTFLLSHHRAVLYTLGDVDAARNMLARKEKRLLREEKRRFQQSLKRLERQKYIHLEKQGEQIFLSLTEKGIQEGLKRTILTKKKGLKKDIFCYVSFDIPERVSSVRWALRELLKKADFKMIHLSLWSSKRDVGKELACFTKIMGAEKWVHVFDAKTHKTLPINI